MRSKGSLSASLAGRLKEPAKAIIESASDNFGVLVQLAALNPERDLRHADLRDVDFSNTDLTGYDFTGCDLRGAHGIRVTWSPETTVLDGAQVEDSLFAHRLTARVAFQEPETARLHRQILGHDWLDQLNWVLRNVRSAAPNLARDRQVAAALFDQATNSYIKGEILERLTRTASGRDVWLSDLMLDIINDQSRDIHLIGKTLRVLSREGWGNDPRCRQAIESLLASTDSRVAARALETLVSLKLTYADARRIAERTRERGDASLIRVFVAAVAKRLGPGFELIVRNPTNREIVPIGRTITVEMMALLLRNIHRMHAETSDTRRPDRARELLPTIEIFLGAIARKELPDQLREMYAVLARAGIVYRIPTEIVDGGADQSPVAVVQSRQSLRMGRQIVS